MNVILIALLGFLTIFPLFADSLGHVLIADSVYGSREITYAIKGKYAIAEGDIILGRHAILSAIGASIINQLGGKKWEHGVVPYEIAEDLPIENKIAALQAVLLWKRNTFVQFVELNSKNRPLYPNYISFVPTTGTTCASFVGMQHGAQTILLAPRCNTMHTAHEIGHALGLWHEQSRQDRDSYIRIVWENIKEEHRYNFEQHLTDGEDFGEYDYNSIMHYAADAFSKNGLATIVPLQENAVIGQRTNLSEKDIAAINALYPDL